MPKTEKYPLTIETSKVGGKFYHRVYGSGVGPEGTGEFDNHDIKILKKINEKIWDRLPKGSPPLVNVMEYKDRGKPPKEEDL